MPVKNDGQPLDDAELARLFAGSATIPDHCRDIVVAVSGGPDSMALMAALARRRALEGNEPRIIAVTVDHGLRPEAEAECALVGREAQKLGLEFRLLRWTGEKPRTGLQEKARKARYRLLLDLCRQEKACLFTAHTLDDQAETVMMRLARGSGITGLRGMSRVQIVDDIWFLRPLLGIAKARLVASCHAWEIPFVTDPSNSSDHFTRVRWRKLLPVLGGEGLDAGRIAAFAERMARADDALNEKVAAALAAWRQTPAGEMPVRLNGYALHEAEPIEIVTRAYARVLGEMPQKQGLPLRLNRLEECVELFDAAVDLRKTLRRTLAGVLIALDRNGILTFAPEPQRKRGRGAAMHADFVAGDPPALGKRGGSS